MLTKEQEDILQYILSLPRSLQNSVSIGTQIKTYPNEIEEKSLIRILNVLEQNSYIRLKWHGTNHNSLNFAVDIFILPDGDNYFTNKKIIKRNKRIDFIKWIIPLFISIISLAISITALVLKLK